MHSVSLKAFPQAINAALKRRAEQQLYRTYTATFLQLIMQHKSIDAMPLYVEILKDICSDGKPKVKQKTAADIITETRKNIAGR